MISRHGKLVYELYTSSFERDDAHYVMSVTKSFVSALIGIAIDRHLISSADATIADTLPRALFPTEADVTRFRGVTLKQVMGMAAIDAPDPPRDKSPTATARYGQFWTAPNRVRFVLGEPLLSEGSFQYNDATPTLATGVLHYVTGKTVFDFADEALFQPMGFRNVEWMHQDASGIDNGGYGLRVRPIDMQKLGLLYLHHGMWQGKQLVSAAWVAQSFQPWNKSRPDHAPDYGWFWWAYDFGAGWTAHVANGWKGQRIAVFPDQDIVLTMTGCIEDGSEHALFEQLVTRVLIPSVAHGADVGSTGGADLVKLLEQVRHGRSRLGDWIEYRMVPSVAHKAERRPFQNVAR